MEMLVEAVCLWFRESQNPGMISFLYTKHYVGVQLYAHGDNCAKSQLHRGDIQCSARKQKHADKYTSQMQHGYTHNAKTR